MISAWIGPVIVAAVISSLVTIAGWWAAAKQERGRDRARRAERILDVQTALRAEIRSHRHRLELFRLAEPFNSGGTNSDDADFTPFIPREVGNIVFESIVGEIHVLPTHVIDPVILYYRQSSALAQLAEDMKNDRFDRLTATRKQSIYRDYLELGRYALVLADRAIEAMESDRDVNNSDEAPSDHRSGASAAAAGARDES